MCGAQTYGTLLDAPRARPQASQPVGSHSSIVYESSHTAEQLAPAHIARGQRIGNSVTDTTSIFGSGITPSAVAKGVSGIDDDPLAKYRVKSTNADADEVDWHSTLRNASRANVEETGNPFHRLDGEPSYVNTPPNQNYRANQASQARPPSEALRKPPAKQATPYVPPSNVHTNVNVVPDPTIKPSVLKEQGDYLEKYRVKNVDPTLTSGATVTSAGGVRPSVFKDQGDDYMDKYRIKTPEEEERTWEISLRNIPASSNKIVELQVDDRQLYSGSGNDKVVSLNFSTMSKSNATSSQFIVKIGLINFNLTRSLELAKGRFVRFSVEQGQMKFRQQKTPFDD